MGFGFVLIFYFIALSIAAAVSSAVLVIATRRYLRGLTSKRTKIATAMAIFPFACVVYAGVWFIAYTVINDTVFHHDPMIGDGWYTDIGNGYAIDMIDVMDHGTVHPARGADNGLNDPEGVSGVRRMQVAGVYIYGSEDLHVFENFASGKEEEDRFFSVNTQTHLKKEFSNEAELAAYAKQNGVTLSLKPIADVYEQYRMNWFEPVAGLFLIIPPACVFCWMILRIVRLKREGQTIAVPQI